MTELTAALRLAISGLVGLGVGIEREWSGHTKGEQARFAGLRTFFMLGLLGGIAGLLLSKGRVLAGAAIVAGAMALAVAAYAMSVRRWAHCRGWACSRWLQASARSQCWH